MNLKGYAFVWLAFIEQDFVFHNLVGQHRWGPVEKSNLYLPVCEIGQCDHELQLPFHRVFWIHVRVQEHGNIDVTEVARLIASYRAKQVGHNDIGLLGQIFGYGLLVNARCLSGHLHIILSCQHQSRLKTCPQGLWHPKFTLIILSASVSDKLASSSDGQGDPTSSIMS